MPPAEPRGRGRPPKPKGTTAEGVIVLRVKTARKAAYVRAAQKQGKTLSAWITEKCDRAAKFADSTL